MLEDGLAWLAEQQEEHNATAIVYRRESLSAEVSIDCLAGRVTHERIALADGRANLNAEPADFLIRPERIDFGGGPVVPLRGDRITVGSRVYEVIDRDGEPCYRPDSQYRAMYRVRTIRVT